MQWTASKFDNLPQAGISPSSSARATHDSSRAGARRWAGRVATGLAALFLLFDAALKVLELAPAVQGTAQLGYPRSAVLGIGLLELACVVLYLLPRSAMLGAVLLTGYLGGAIASHVRSESPLLSHTLFPLYVAALIWGGLYLRDARVRALLAAPRAL